MKTLLPNTFFILLLFSFGLFVSNSNKDHEEYLPISGEVISPMPISSGGSPGNYTGSPGDGSNCTACHSAGASYSLVPTISTNIPGSGYVLGQTYLITVSTTSSGANSWGFELTAEKSDNSDVGVFDISGATGSPQVILSGSAVTQTSDSNSSWSFNWTAPATSQDQVTFYAAVIAGAGQGTQSDETVLTSETITDATLGVRDEDMLVFDIYPNPSNQFVTIQLPEGLSNSSVKLFDNTGRNIKSAKINKNNNELDLSDVSQGVYYIMLNSDGKTGVQTLIKN